MLDFKDEDEIVTALDLLVMFGLVNLSRNTFLSSGLSRPTASQFLDQIQYQCQEENRMCSHALDAICFSLLQPRQFGQKRISHSTCKNCLGLLRRIQLRRKSRQSLKFDVYNWALLILYWVIFYGRQKGAYNSTKRDSPSPKKRSRKLPTFTGSEELS